MLQIVQSAHKQKARIFIAGVKVILQNTYMLLHKTE